MKIWVDADAAPRDVKNIVQNAARRLRARALFVSNQRLVLPPANPFLTAVRVEGGPDVADRYIVDHSAPGDVAVTADIPLAATLIERGVVCIDPRGEVFTSENIGERMSVRAFMDGMRGAGLETGGARPFGPRDRQNFANALDRVLARVQKPG